MMLGLSKTSLLRCNGCNIHAETDSSYSRTRIDPCPHSGMVALGSDGSSWALSASPTGIPGISNNLLFAEATLGPNLVHPKAVFR